MRVLMVQTFHYHRGGDSTYMLNLTKLLEEHGHEVIHFAMEHPDNLPSQYSRHFARGFDYPALLRERSPGAAWTVLARGIYNRDARDRIAVLARETRPDIAHFHNIHAYLTTSIIAPLRDAGIPIVWTMHDYRMICPNSDFLSNGEICERCLPRSFHQVLLRRCKKGSLAASAVAMVKMYFERLSGSHRRIARFIAPSEFLRRKMIDGGFDPARITTLPNFVDAGSYGPPSGGGYILYFGRLSHEKGVDILIEAAAGLDEGEIRIAGEGPEGDGLRELARRRAPGRVRFEGYMSGERLRAAIAGARFVVLPSRWYENLPFSIMEAFASGVPVIASRTGGIPEMVDDGVDGFLFEVGDEAELRDRMRRLLADPGLCRVMGERARAKALERYDRAGHYEAIMELYRRVVNSSGGS